MSQLALDLIEKEKQERTGYLDLGNCGLTELPQELFELIHLETLILSNEYWDDEQKIIIMSPNLGEENRLNHLPNEIEELSQLKKLMCGGNGRNKWAIENVSFLGSLIKLEALYLSDNLISDINFLVELKHLQKLDLSYNKISKISEISKLAQLQILNLRFNHITNVKEISNLSQLKVLDISQNKISDISFLCNYKNLHTLNLWQNQISDFRHLMKLKELISLDLGGNNISDINFIGSLLKLEKLGLLFNQISDISPISKLKQLRSLILSHNQISDISPLSELTQLNSLQLGSNQISDINILRNLKQLKFLEIRQNNITDLSALQDLNCLSEVFLGNNPVTEGYNVPYMGSSLDFLKTWLEKKRVAEEDKVMFYVPTKVLFLGNHAAGKSCLLHYFKNQKLKKEENDSTHVLNIDRINLNKGNKKIMGYQSSDEVMPLYLYDFGGQDFYHGLYQAFTKSQGFHLLLFHKGSNENKEKPDSKGRNQINHNI